MRLDVARECTTRRIAARPPAMLAVVIGLVVASRDERLDADRLDAPEAGGLRRERLVRRESGRAHCEPLAGHDLRRAGRC